MKSNLQGPEEGGFRITQILSILGFRRVHTLIVARRCSASGAAPNTTREGLNVRVRPLLGLERRTQASRDLSRAQLLSRLPR